MKKKILIIGCIIAVIGITLAFAGYYMSKNVMTSLDVFADAYEEIKNFFGEKIELDDKTFEASVHYETNNINNIENNDVRNLLIGNNFDFNIKVDYENNIELLTLNSFYRDSSSLNLIRYYENNIEYSNVGNYYNNKFIINKYNEEFFNEIIGRLKTNVYKLDLLNYMFESFFNKSNNEYFFQEYSTSMLDKESSKINNNITVDKNNYMQIVNNIVENLKDNEDFLKKYEFVYNKKFSVSDYVLKLEYFLTHKLTLNIYTEKYTNKLLELEIVITENDTSGVKFYTSVKLNEKNYTFVMNTPYLFIEGILTKQEDVYILNLKTPVFYNKNDRKDLEIKIRFSYKYIDNIDKPDTSNSILYDEMNVEDVDEIFQLIKGRNEMYNLRQLYYRYKFLTQ